MDEAKYNQARLDTHFEEVVIKSVNSFDDGYQVSREDGWTFWLDKENCPFEPKSGSKMKLWGGGLGHAIRGLMVDDTIFFYRTEEEQTEYAANLRFGKDAKEWLERWDRGDLVWTVTLGGLGCGYDQVINLLVAELVRAMLKVGVELNPDGNALTKECAEKVESEVAEAAHILGPSGAQYGVAKHFAFALVLDGPRKAIESVNKERHVMASKHYPSLDEGRLSLRVEKAIKTFDADPPDSDFQRGYLAALRELLES